MKNQPKALSRTGITLTKIQKNLEFKTIIEHQLNIIHLNSQKEKYEANLTSILQKEVGMSYMAALFLKKAMIDNKTIVAVSRSGIKFRNGISKPNPKMVDFAIQTAIKLQNQLTNHRPSEKKDKSVAVVRLLSDYTAKELVAELRMRGYTVKAYIEI